MHILSFKIKGLAGRDGYFSHELDRHVNVFFGLNGSGKTSLLKILHSALSGKTAILNNVPFERAEVTFYSLDHKQTYVTSLENKFSDSRQEQTSALIEYGSNESRFYETIISPSQVLKWKYSPKLPEKSTGDFAHAYLPTWRIYTNYRTVPIELLRNAREDDMSENYWDYLFAKSLENLWSRYSNTILSQVQQIQADGLANILKSILKPKKRKNQNTLSKPDPEIAYNRIAAFLERQSSSSILGPKNEFFRRYQKEPHLMAIASDINEIEKKVEEVKSSRLSLEKLIRNMFLSNKNMNFSDTGIEVTTPKGKKIGLESLSSGEKQVLRIFIETLMARMNSLIIDEPEISLHIDWQRLLISSMRVLNPDAQLILATHSPEIMAEIPDDKIYNLWAN